MPNATPAPPATLAPPAIPATLAVMPRAARASVALQAAPPQTAAIVTRAVDAALLPFVPESARDAAPTAAMREDCREWLAAEAVSIRGRNGTTGAQASVDYGPPPAGLGAVECLLWQSLGCACARGALWLARYLKTHRWMVACRESGLESHEVNACAIASPMFALMLEGVKTTVRGGTVAQTEDTLADLANGAMRKIKTERDADGNTVKEVDEGAVYDMKAAALLLPALDPARYGGAGKGGGGAGVSITVNVAPGLGWASRGGGAVIEAEVVEGEGD
jgi:hypothetical protein